MLYTPPSYSMFSGNQRTNPAYQIRQPQMGQMGSPAGQTAPGYFNDPTLAAGNGGMSSGGGAPTAPLPPGAIQPGIQFGNGQVPQYWYAKGYRRKMGQNGQFFWAPPDQFGRAADAVPGTNTNRLY